MFLALSIKEQDIMVSQDFMFAGGMIPSDELFFIARFLNANKKLFSDLVRPLYSRP